MATEVEAWRADHRLPFPEFEAEERARLADTLAFPPEGSPHHQPPTAAPERLPEEHGGGRRRWQLGGLRGNLLPGSP